MKTPLPKIEDARKAHKEELEKQNNTQREAVIAEILKNYPNGECRINSYVSRSIRSELILAGYDVHTIISMDGTRTVIKWQNQ